MCLSRIKKKFGNNDKIVMAYKVYRKTPKRYADQFQHGLRQEGKHYKSRSSISYNGYEMGFHAYTNLKVAKLHCWSPVGQYSEFCVCKVLLWDIAAIGDQGSGKNVIVGRNLRIMEEIYRRKKRP